EHVERPGAQLAEFAIAHDVDAGLGLLADHLRDLLAQAGIVRILIDGHAALDRLDVAHHARRAHQAADMGGEDAVCHAVSGPNGRTPPRAAPSDRACRRTMSRPTRSA